MPPWSHLLNTTATQNYCDSVPWELACHWCQRTWFLTNWCHGPWSSVCRLQRWHDMYFIYNLIKIGLRLACVPWAKRDYIGILPQIMRRSAVVQCLGALWLPLKTALLPSMACNRTPDWAPVPWELALHSHHQRQRWSSRWSENFTSFCFAYHVQRLCNR